MLRRVRQSLRQVLLLMARRPDILCGAIVLSVLLILAVKFTCSRAKDVVAAARPPVRFFSADAPVVDLYLGQLDQVERLKSMAEVSFIFFYAPWCAHSMAARQEVSQVAKKLARQVQFVAVNCWWSQGKCRRQKRFYHYPIIHLFYRRFGPIEYRGPFVAPYIESFTLRVITPLTYLPTRAHLENFLTKHESGVVGFFQFNSSPQPPGYITYLSSALQTLRRDFHGVVRFGVVTSKHVAEAVSLREDETVYLHRRFNSSLIFPRKKLNFTSEAVCKWVFEHYETVVQWLVPPGTKSRLLEDELTKGPALLLFMPHDPLKSEPSAILQQFADIAVRYHSCERSSTDDRLPFYTSLCCRSVPVQESRTSACEVCLRLSGPSLPVSLAPCSFPSASREGDRFETYLNRCCLHQPPSPISMKSATSQGCSHYVSSYSPFTQFSACCKTVEPQLNQSQAKEEPGLPPPLSVPPSSAPIQETENDGIMGLHCRTNRTLRFYVLDIGLNWPLAERLGALSQKNSSIHKGASTEGDGNRDCSFVAIVNLKYEVHYVLQHNPDATLTESLEMFIRNFSSPHSHLQRHLVGEDDRKEGGGGGGADPSEEEQQKQRRLITELTTSSFVSSIMDHQKDVLLFYYTQWCGFCSVLNHVLIQLARLLQGNHTITVARVNVARNDLPWEFMVDHVPSILLFPRHRKHLSVKYPANLPITLPNLLRFILQHSDSLRQANGSSAAAPGSGSGSGSSAVLHAEFLALQHEVQALHHARQRLSQQLAQLWRENRQLKFDIRGIEQSLERQMQEKSRQLAEALKRLQELADASETLLNENVLLKVLLRALRDQTEADEQAEADREEAGQEDGRRAS
ncbi:thioredoxin domain-containing protein 11 [Poecilia latipinna]|uniref:Thioredoxin domain containing 11 n=1 Tax=Poecilia latipinna TaxID=48699 RepID=A0A3B3TQV4_9TELE|nr:PREDICTED: thioredoxin domain-containing protein 11 [Poecilia latipinna]